MRSSSRRIQSLNRSKLVHGTRGRYVAGCRCADCRRANTAYYHARCARRRDQAADVQPSGPPIAGELVRNGAVYRIVRCPGANGSPCVRGGTWLRTGDQVCVPCIERVTVWNGLVDAAPVRAHVLELGRIGVGFKSVAAAASMASSQVGAILAGRQTQLRADTARRILAVDEGARAGGSRVSTRGAHRRVRQMLQLGFTRGGIALELGYKTLALQLGRRATLKNVLAIEKLWRRIERGEVMPRPRNTKLRRELEDHRQELLVDLAQTRPGA